MRLQFIFGEIAIGLRRNIAMAVSVVLVTVVSLFLLGLGFLAQRQVDTMKDYWFDKVQVSIFLCGTDSDAVTCSNSRPCGLIRKCLLSLPGTSSEVWVAVRSAQP